MWHRKLLNKTSGIILLLLVAGLSSDLCAQNEKETLRAMYATYSSLSSLQMNVNVQLFAKSSDITPMQQSSGKVYKDGLNYFSEMMGRATLINKNCALIVDNSNRIIMYSEPEGKAKDQKTDDILPDSVLFGQSKMKTLSNKDNHHCIEVKYDNDPQYDRIEMTVNTVNHTLEKIVYYFKPMNGRSPLFEKLAISYTSIVINGDISSSVFSEKSFVSVSRNKVTPLGKYATYEVIDQRVYNKQTQ